MDKYTTTRDGNRVTITDTATGIGLLFNEGESLQRYISALFLPDPSIMETEEGVARVGRISQELEDYASSLFPEEFKEIN